MKTLAQHIADTDVVGINLKSSVMEYAALSRGCTVDRLSKTVIVVRSPDGTLLAFNNMNGPHSSQVGRELCGRKDVSLELLSRASIPTPVSRSYVKHEHDTAWNFAESLQKKIVVKPTRLSRGRGVSTDIIDKNSFRMGWKNAFEAYSTPSSRNKVIVQEQFFGEDYRLFVVDGNLISATHRRRPSVEGDGESTISALIEAKNVMRRHHPTLRTYPIPVHEQYLDELTSQGRRVSDVPAAGERVVLRRTSNLSGGGDSVDVTDEVHAVYKQAAQSALRTIPGMAYLGVDIITPDISRAPAEGVYVVTEVEYSPGPMTDFPIEGYPRDMGGAIMDYYLDLNI